jgi:hypothetical protein
VKLLRRLWRWFTSTLLVQNLKAARTGWKTNPQLMITNILLSFLFGQLIFEFLGYDQLGIFQHLGVQMGLGQKFAAWFYGFIPHVVWVAWLIKVVEILTDALKMPIEGRLYRRQGLVPDVVAAAVTQPLWSGIEASEKLLGAILYPALVAHPDKILVSLGCIYGSCFRDLLAGMLWVCGNQIHKRIGRPIESGLHRLTRALRRSP